VALTWGAYVQEPMPNDCAAVVPAYPQPLPVAKVRFSAPATLLASTLHCQSQ